MIALLHVVTHPCPLCSRVAIASSQDGCWIKSYSRSGSWSWNRSCSEGRSGACGRSWSCDRSWDCYKSRSMNRHGEVL
jgi:hypothetical protein